MMNAQPMGEGIGWKLPDSMEATAPLTGFSHGASGIGFALLRLFSATGEVRYRDAAIDAFRYERTQFDSAEGNWYDLRKNAEGHDGRPATAISWCHGAPGIGLARIYALNFTDDPAIQADLDAALSTTSKQGFGIGHCLCHGDMGNLDLFLEADEIQPHVGWIGRARAIAGSILQSAKEGWLCGTPSNMETSEFMVGLAGIGYGLLRLAHPKNIASVLTLKAPMTNHAVAGSVRSFTTEELGASSDAAAEVIRVRP
jgi:lantibiotic modifying enzyme